MTKDGAIRQIGLGKAGALSTNAFPSRSLGTREGGLKGKIALLVRALPAHFNLTLMSGYMIGFAEKEL